MVSFPPPRWHQQPGASTGLPHLSPISNHRPAQSDSLVVRLLLILRLFGPASQCAYLPEVLNLKQEVLNLKYSDILPSFTLMFRIWVLKRCASPESDHHGPSRHAASAQGPEQRPARLSLSRETRWSQSSGCSTLRDLPSGAAPRAQSPTHYRASSPLTRPRSDPLSSFGAVAWKVDEGVRDHSAVPPPNALFVLEAAHAEVLQWGHSLRLANPASAASPTLLVAIHDPRHQDLRRRLSRLCPWEVLALASSGSLATAVNPPASLVVHHTGFHSRPHRRGTR